MTLWEIDIHPASDQIDRLGIDAASSVSALGLGDHIKILAARGFLLQGDFDQESDRSKVLGVLADAITECAVCSKAGADELQKFPTHSAHHDSIQAVLSHDILLHVLPKPGVTDPVAQSTLRLLKQLGCEVEAVRTFRKYWIYNATSAQIEQLSKRVLANDSIEQVVVGPLAMTSLNFSGYYNLKISRIPISTLDDEQLLSLSKTGQLYLSLTEMKTIQTYYQGLGREPTDIELETVAQTWSEHCSHKTLAGRIAYQDENGSRQFDNMLKETIFAATNSIRKTMGADDWCVSVFKDNAGVVKFDDEDHVVFKVETHNHPSAIEPYGGANTGLGGVIRDPLGTGLGAKPVCSTDVFCFAPPDTKIEDLPPGVLHPRRVMQGVVAGVRDYGNRMGIPTVNGAVYFDRRYLGNPLVYCGNVGMLPVNKVEKQPLVGDLIVAIGGRTGRDGIHGATFSSVELTEESEDISGGAVQIGNAVTEKMVLDVLMQARDQGLYTAVTDCGAGGFSSAIGEMGETLGADVHLDRAPLKYEGLTYTEIWISEAQERMVLSVPPECWEQLEKLCASEGVEAACLGTFTGSGNLRLIFRDIEVGSISVRFLHDGRPPIVRQAIYQPKPKTDLNWPDTSRSQCESMLSRILADPNVASKHWIIRQYDHEVQAGSVIKPLVGPKCDAPSDAAVIQPKLTSRRGLVIACGMNPNYGDYDPYDMACSAIDEAVRNCVAVGADPSRIAILDNFCWGNTDRPETLGELVRSALGCHDLSVHWQTPFISGKDSLNNEFSYQESQGQRKTIAIPSSLLISAMGQIGDVRKSISMDLKSSGNRLFLVGVTKEEFGGSMASKLSGQCGGQVPQVDASLAMRCFRAIHQAISNGLVRSCHDCSEGGVAVALAEMAFGGGIGIEIDLVSMQQQNFIDAWTALFAESNSRLICEVTPANLAGFQMLLGDLPCYEIGETTDTALMTVRSGATILIECPLEQLKATWLAPLDWA